MIEGTIEKEEMRHGYRNHGEGAGTQTGDKFSQTRVCMAHSLRKSQTSNNGSGRKRRCPWSQSTKGDLLVADGLVLTKKSRPFVHGWILLEDKRARDIEVDLRESGWHFFYLVPDVQGTAIARSRERAVRKALEKICARGRENGVNALEIASVSAIRVLGLHRAKVIAKLRHIQESPYLFTTTEAMHRRKPVFPEGPDWTTEPWSEIPGIPKPIRIDDRRERNHV